MPAFSNLLTILTLKRGKSHLGIVGLRYRFQIGGVPSYRAAVDKLSPFECDGVELHPYVSVTLQTRPIWAVEIGGISYATGVEASERFEEPQAARNMICDWFRKARQAGRFRGNHAVEPG